MLNQKLMTEQLPVKDMARAHTCLSFLTWETVGYLSGEKVNFTLPRLSQQTPCERSELERGLGRIWAETYFVTGPTQNS